MSFYIVFTTVSGSISKSIPLQPSEVKYEAIIENQIAYCQLHQTFRIDKTYSTIESASYQFPVDYNSAFCGLLIKTPREEIKGVVKEKEDAKRLFSEAKKSGKQAFMVEENETDRDIYKLSVCNILPGDEIVVRYEYITEITSNKIDKSNINAFYIPSFISPRYGGEFISSGNHSIQCTIRFRSRDVSSIAISMPNTTIDIDDGIYTAKCSSAKPLDKDIEVQYKKPFVDQAIKFKVDDCTMAITNFIAPSAIQLQPSQKELVFILDCSGSMDGDRIKSSRKAITHCLNKMKNNKYLFNIVKFGSNTDIFSKKMLDSDESNIEKAISYCNEIQANMGGTELFGAIALGLSMSKVAILITDGDTSGNDNIHNLCSRFDCLSVLGIGSGINRANISDIAQRGNGLALFSQTEDSIERNISTIFDSIDKPVIRSPITNWNHGLTTVGPIILNNPNTYCTIFEHDQSDLKDFKLKELDFTLNLSEYSGLIPPKYLGSFVAKRVIQTNHHLTDDKIKTLATKFNIVTKNTTLIAVGDNVVVNEPKSLDTGFWKNESVRCNFMSGKHSRCVRDIDISSDPFSYRRLDCRSDPHVERECSRKTDLYGLFWPRSPRKYDEEEQCVQSEPNFKKEMNKEIKTISGFTTIESLVKYFDEITGLFTNEVSQIITNIPDKYLSDRVMLTIFIIYYLSQLPINVKSTKFFKEFIRCHGKNVSGKLISLGVIEWR